MEEKWLSEDSRKIFQGAESRVFRGTYLDQEVVYKHRFDKQYRHPTLNKELTKQRIRSEVRNLSKCRAHGIDCPAIIAVRPRQGLLCLELIPGQTIASFLTEGNAHFDKFYATLPERLGRLLAKFHDSLKHVHGDLTTSNVIMRHQEDDYSLALLDFGLAGAGETAEDRAVDLYVLERAIASSHAQFATDFNQRMLAEYESVSPKAKDTIKRLEIVRQRGRKRIAFG